jgi:hypothetical protein
MNNQEPTFATDIQPGDLVELVERDEGAVDALPVGVAALETGAILFANEARPFYGTTIVVAFPVTGRVAVGKFRVVRRHLERAPEFDTDIRIGDVVEVVSIDEEAMRTDGCRVTDYSTMVGQRLLVAISGESGFGSRQQSIHGDAARADGNGVVRYYRHGRFRILERDGKAYVRSVEEKRDTIPVPAPDAADAMAQACERVHEHMQKALAAQVVKPEAPRCAWCAEPIAPGAKRVIHLDIGTAAHGECNGYYEKLRERLSTGGAHDTPEERESVRRFVDAERQYSRCACGAQTSEHRSCADCRTLKVMPRRPLDARIAEADDDPPSCWQAGATPGAEWP